MFPLQGTGAASFDEFGNSKYQNRRTMSSSDRAMLNAFKEISTMADRINLPRNIVVRCCCLLVSQKKTKQNQKPNILLYWELLQIFFKNVLFENIEIKIALVMQLNWIEFIIFIKYIWAFTFFSHNRQFFSHYRNKVQL